MKKLALVILACLITVTVIRYSVGNDKPITESLLEIEFDDMEEVMGQLRLSVTMLTVTTNNREQSLEVLKEKYEGRGSEWLRTFADKLPGIFSNTKEALYTISKSAWVNGNETWAVVQAHIEYIGMVITGFAGTIAMGGELIRASAGKLVEIVTIILFR